MKPDRILPDVHVLSSYVPLPTIGLLPVNAYLVKGRQPYLVDTGVFSEARAMVSAVEEVMDPVDLRWIYLTHVDPDHIGALLPLLDRAPEARIVTTFLGMGKLGLLYALPPQRFYLLNPGEHLDLGDRRLTPMRPPIFDAPETLAMHDDSLDVLFSSDCFGGPVEAPIRRANELPSEGLEKAQLLWASVDSPWVFGVRRDSFQEAIDRFAEIEPEWVLSTHLPPAHRMMETLCRNLARAPEGEPFLGPNQAQLEQLFARMPQHAP